MSDQRFNLSDKDRLVIAKALRNLASDLRNLFPKGSDNESWEEAAYCEALADKMGTSA